MWHNTSWLSNLVGRDLGPWQLYPFPSCWLSYVIISGSLVKSLSVRQLQCPSVHHAFIFCLPQFKTECFTFRIKVPFTVLHFPTRPEQVWRISISMLPTQQFHHWVVFLVFSQMPLLHYPLSSSQVDIISLGQVQCCYLGTLWDFLCGWLLSFSLLDFAVLEDIAKK